MTDTATPPNTPHRVVIVGAGFGGLEAANSLRNADVAVTVVDQRNHHLFQPLLYQVATSTLATSEIAWPIRHLLRKYKNIKTLLGTVESVDTAARTISTADGEVIAYDTLVLATGARHAYFGHDDWEPFAPGLKTLEDATTIRRRILTAFEKAEREPDPARRAALLTFVIIGAGPTGVEIAGTIADLARDTLKGEFRVIDPATAQVILIEGGARVLGAFAPDLSAYAQRALEKLGVQVHLGNPVMKCTADGVEYAGKFVGAATIIWAAGVQASPAAKWLDVPADRAGRVVANDDLTAPGHPDIFVIGDTATVKNGDKGTVPGIAPAAKQQGIHVAKAIRARLAGDIAPKPFRYRHAGDLATIGKRAAVTDFGWIKFKGYVAWWLWGLAHIYFLIGVRNRLAVAMSWLWISVSGTRSARLITQKDAADEDHLK
ncbi:NAD(P)/FAD-dependent oxidoreductase [Phyllobacterium myrsinacearum]|uniref:NADH:ubiquinone reductase (non-electrogenic) n=1 Tax=Phyllobacterium myrsinacearum TaxID=28101 RepID=A0A2S9JYS8_9HYPH|nr:NAD(P)/FAD-dependent oxidoreductase [Phyllobacterium myrsinacearum]PRD58490.1 FAD-dependent oxidoreductase [Phyllobacterium myrsinacearum]PWV96729.1 NADH dehydrogenase FAD-containing subunit [Phyllobacterium myrsinacearum]RZV09279.1 NADH dehydrogenase [Phyllobacterium myrsinacearum]